MFADIGLDQTKDISHFKSYNDAINNPYCIVNHKVQKPIKLAILR